MHLKFRRLVVLSVGAALLLPLAACSKDEDTVPAAASGKKSATQQQKTLTQSQKAPSTDQSRSEVVTDKQQAKQNAEGIAATGSLAGESDAVIAAAREAKGRGDMAFSGTVRIISGRDAFRSVGEEQLYESWKNSAEPTDGRPAETYTVLALDGPVSRSLFKYGEAMRNDVRALALDPSKWNKYANKHVVISVNPETIMITNLLATLAMPWAEGAQVIPGSVR